MKHAAAKHSQAEIELDLLVEAIYRQYHYDFRHYARASLARRSAAAMSALGVASLSELQHRVLRDPALFTTLLDYLTVQVSEMFRDPAYFRALRERVVPLLRTYPSLKIWVAGCSSGEEAYSMAILLAECGLLERSLIYATDINAEALRKADAGVYAADRIAGFTENHRRSGASGSLAEWFTVAYDRAVIDSSLKKRIVWSDHSLATDSVFAEVHLVSCRNVLIYFDRKLQSRAVALFRDALVRRGFLGIGAKESLQFTEPGVAFEPVSAADRVYRKRADAA